MRIPSSFIIYPKGYHIENNKKDYKHKECKHKSKSYSMNGNEMYKM